MDRKKAIQTIATIINNNKKPRKNLSRTTTNTRAKEESELIDKTATEITMEIIEKKNDFLLIPRNKEISMVLNAWEKTRALLGYPQVEPPAIKTNMNNWGTPFPVKTKDESWRPEVNVLSLRVFHKYVNKAWGRQIYTVKDTETYVTSEFIHLLSMRRFCPMTFSNYAKMLEKIYWSQKEKQHSLTHEKTMNYYKNVLGIYVDAQATIDKKKLLWNDQKYNPLIDAHRINTYFLVTDRKIHTPSTLWITYLRLMEKILNNLTSTNKQNEEGILWMGGGKTRITDYYSLPSKTMKKLEKTTDKLLQILTSNNQDMFEKALAFFQTIDEYVSMSKDVYHTDLGYRSHHIAKNVQKLRKELDTQKKQLRQKIRQIITLQITKNETQPQPTTNNHSHNHNHNHNPNTKTETRKEKQEQRKHVNNADKSEEKTLNQNTNSRQANLPIETEKTTKQTTKTLNNTTTTSKPDKNSNAGETAIENNPLPNTHKQEKQKHNNPATTVNNNTGDGNNKEKTMKKTMKNKEKNNDTTKEAEKILERLSTELQEELITALINTSFAENILEEMRNSTSPEIDTTTTMHTPSEISLSTAEKLIGYGNASLRTIKALTKKHGAIGKSNTPVKTSRPKNNTLKGNNIRPHKVYFYMSKKFLNFKGILLENKGKNKEENIQWILGQDSFLLLEKKKLLRSPKPLPSNLLKKSNTNTPSKKEGKQPTPLLIVIDTSASMGRPSLINTYLQPLYGLHPVDYAIATGIGLAMLLLEKRVPVQLMFFSAETVKTGWIDSPTQTSKIDKALKELHNTTTIVPLKEIDRAITEWHQKQLGKNTATETLSELGKYSFPAVFVITDAVITEWKQIDQHLSKLKQKTSFFHLLIVRKKQEELYSSKDKVSLKNNEHCASLRLSPTTVLREAKNEFRNMNAEEILCSLTTRHPNYFFFDLVFDSELGKHRNEKIVVNIAKKLV